MECNKGFWSFTWHYFYNLWNEKISELKELNQYNNFLKK